MLNLDDQECVCVRAHTHRHLCFRSKISDVYLTIQFPKGVFHLLTHSFQHHSPKPIDLRTLFSAKNCKLTKLNDEICWATNIKTDVRILCLSKIVRRISSMCMKQVPFFCKEKKGEICKKKRLEVIFKNEFMCLHRLCAQITINSNEIRTNF